MQPTNHAQLLRHLGLWTAVAIVAGAAIGSGIFKKPAVMAEQLGSPELMLVIWVLAGVITLFGAMTNAEIAGMIPESGGQYIYFNKIYNHFVGYLYGWSVFIVIQTGSIASITYVFAEYLGYFFQYPEFSEEVAGLAIPIPLLGAIYPLQDIGTKIVTIGTICFLTLVNYLGVRFGGYISLTFTASKLIAIIALIVLGFSIGNGDALHFTQSASQPITGSVFLAVILALSGAFWAYDGWNNITYAAGEIKSPQRNIPRALIIGLSIVIVVYFLINLAYLYILSVDEMVGSKLVAADMANAFLGTTGAGIVSALVMVSTFGTANGSILASARVYHAMARQNYFFPRAGTVSQRFKTPATALLIQAVWASLLTMSGTFDQLTNMLIFVSWVFYALGAFGVFVLRRKMPDAVRPYRVWGYPFVPAIFVLFAAVFVVFTVYSDISLFSQGKIPLINSLAGIGLVALGLPGYFFWKRRRDNR